MNKTPLYPSCDLSEDYPILLRVPAEVRATYVAQAQAGIPLTAEQSAALGFSPSLGGGVLLPADARKATRKQIVVMVGGDKKVLGEILTLGIGVSA